MSSWIALWLNWRLSRLVETSLLEVQIRGTTPTPRSKARRETRMRLRRRGGAAGGSGSGFTGCRPRRLGPPGAHHLEDAHFPFLALRGEAAQAPALELAGHHAMGVLADHQHPRLGHRALQPARGVHGVPEHRVLLLVHAADLPRHRLAAVDPDADAEVRP